MKRVKKGYERHGEARWFENNGRLCIEQRSSASSRAGES